MDEAVDLVKEADVQDTMRNYKEAAKTYRETIRIFHNVAQAICTPGRGQLI